MLSDTRYEFYDLSSVLLCSCRICSIPEVNAAAPTGENVLKVEEGYVFDYSDGTLTYMRVIVMEDEEGIIYNDTYEITV